MAPNRRCHHYHLAAVVGLVLLPVFLACRFDADDHAIHCRNATLEQVSQSLRILATIVNVTAEPQKINFEDCYLPELPFLLPPFNRTLSSIRISGSRLRHVYPDAFMRLESTLRYLDLSHNELRFVPYAVGTLHSLEVLLLEGNRIAMLPPTPVFAQMKKLQVLSLAHNLLGLSSQDAAEVHTVDKALNDPPYQFAEKLTLDEFSLGPTPRTLAVLNLRGNLLKTVPHQIYKTAFPQLLLLDLSENRLSSIPELIPSLLPKLQTLDLHDNRIQKFNFHFLPMILQWLNLSGNPAMCDCSATWLLDWQASNKSVLQLPQCHEPEHLRGRNLSSLWKYDLCPEGDNRTTLPYMIHSTQSDIEDGFAILNVTSREDSIMVNWLAGMENGTEWRLVYRKESDSPQQLVLNGNTPSRTVWENNDPFQREQLAQFTETIISVEPNAPYVVCVAAINEGKFVIHPNRCRSVRTSTVQPLNVATTDSVSSLPIEVSSRLSTTTGIRTILTDIFATQSSIVVTWKVELPSDRAVTRPSEGNARVTENGWHRHEWLLRIRRYSTSNITEVKLGGQVDAEDLTYEHAFTGLAYRTGYDVCLVALDTQLEVPSGEDFLRPSVGEHRLKNILGDTKGQAACKEMVTRDGDTFPVTEVAVATTVSTSATVVVVLICCFCCPKISRCKRKRASSKGQMQSSIEGLSSDSLAEKERMRLEKDEEADEMSDPESELTKGVESQGGLFVKEANSSLLGKGINTNEAPASVSSKHSRLSNRGTGPDETRRFAIPHFLAIDQTPLPDSPFTIRSNSSQFIKDIEPKSNLQKEETTDMPLITIEDTTPTDKVEGADVENVEPVVRKEECPTTLQGSVSKTSKLSTNSKKSRKPRSMTRSQRARQGIERTSSIRSRGRGTHYSTLDTRGTCKTTKSLPVRAEGYINPKDLQYISGKKVQIFVNGSKTLPRNFRGPCFDDSLVFHPRYSLPHAFRRKGRPEANVERQDSSCSDRSVASLVSSSGPLWFQSSSWGGYGSGLDAEDYGSRSSLVPDGSSFTRKHSTDSGFDMNDVKQQASQKEAEDPDRHYFIEHV